MKICNKDMQRPDVKQHVFLAGWGSFEASDFKYDVWVRTFDSDIKVRPQNKISMFLMVGFFLEAG